MKKFNKFLLIALVGLCITFGFAGANSIATTKSYADGVVYVNLNVGKDVSLVLTANIENAVSAKTTFTWTGNDAAGETNRTAYVDTIAGEKNENGSFVFRYKGVGVQYFGKEINAVITYDTDDSADNVYAEKTFSVKDVIISYRSSTAEKLSVSPSGYDALKTLSTDILNYGAAAQKLTKVDTSALVNDGLTDGTVVDFTALTGEIPAKGELGWGMGVKFDYNLQPMAKFTSAAQNLTAKINGEDAEIETLGENEYRIVYKDFNILSFADEYTFEVFSDGASIGSATCSLAALAKKHDSEILRTAYTYATSVKNFVEAKKTVVIEAESDYVVRKKSDGSSLNIGDENGVTFVKDLESTTYANASLTFRVIADNDCEATLNATFKMRPWEFPLNQYVAIEVNGVEFDHGKILPLDKSVTNDSPRNEWHFTSIELGTIALKKGPNTIKFIVKEESYPQCPEFDKIELIATAAVRENTHKCQSICPACGKCTNLDCTEDACKEKCTCVLSVIEAESNCVTFTQAENPIDNGVVKGYGENGGYVKAENNNAGSKITFTVTADKAGKALLRVYVAPRSFDYYFHNDYKVVINGTEYSFESKMIAKDEELSDNQWLARNYVCVVIGEIDLVEDDNTIEFVQKSYAGTIMDKIDMISSTVTVTESASGTNE